MTRVSAIVAAIFFGFTMSGTCAQAQLPPTEEIVKGALGGAVESIIIEHLKGEKFSGNDNWGHKVSGLLGKQKDGLWTRFEAKPENPSKNIDFKILDLERKGSDTAIVDLRLSVYMRGHAQAQVWKYGYLLGDVDTEVRAKVILTATINLKLKGDLASATFVVKPTVTKADIDVDDFVTDKIGYIGGFSAKVLGDCIQGCVSESFDDAKPGIVSDMKAAMQRALDQADMKLQLRDFLK